MHRINLIPPAPTHGPRPSGRGPVWVFLRTLFACLGGGFVACLSASEPSFSPNPAADHSPAAEPSAIVTALLNGDPSAPPRPRRFTEADLLALLTSTLQQDYVKDKGELELRLTQPWAERTLPDEPISVKILDLPRSGVATSFIIKFELRTAARSLGTFQLPLQARVWREIWVARTLLKRGDAVAEAELDRERRDVLALHEPIADFSAGDPSLELAEPITIGSPLLARSVRARPVIRRGQSADALLQDGSLSITMKVEALEDGAPGQTIRARNSQSRRDLRGKVLNEQTILISL